MNLKMNEERQKEAIGKFLIADYKANFKKGRLIKTLIFSFVLIVVSIGLSLVPGYKVTAYILITCALIASFLSIFPFIMFKKIAKKGVKKIEINIESMEFEFEENIQVAANYTNGSIEKAQYNYEDIKKVVETEEFFFLYLNYSAALTVDKLEIENKEEFLDLFIKRGIKIMEVKCDEI